MSLRRFLVQPEELNQAEVILSRAEAAHARKVLRLAPGARVQLLDGEGRVAHAVLVRVGKKEVAARIEEVTRPRPLSPRLVLCLGLLKGPAMDNLARMLTELMVDQVRPFASDRSVPRIKDPQPRLERWQRLAGQALKQCGAAGPPRFSAPASLEDILGQAPTDAARLILYENETGITLAQAAGGVREEKEVWILIGPEGGFAPEEVQTASQAGFTPCGLPGAILRAETAALAAASVLRFGLK